MVDIQPAAAEIRRGKKKDRRKKESTIHRAAIITDIAAVVSCVGYTVTAADSVTSSCRTCHRLIVTSLKYT